jgi:hypothetical protein
MIANAAGERTRTIRLSRKRTARGKAGTLSIEMLFSECPVQRVTLLIAPQLPPGTVTFLSTRMRCVVLATFHGKT